MPLLVELTRLYKLKLAIDYNSRHWIAVNADAFASLFNTNMQIQYKYNSHTATRG